MPVTLTRPLVWLALFTAIATAHADEPYRGVTTGAGNALSPPAARHVVRLNPGNGKPPTYLIAVQRDGADPVHPGLSFFRSDDEGVTWGFYRPIAPDYLGQATSVRFTADLVAVGNDVALVYSYDGPELDPNPVTDPKRKVYFQWWRYSGATARGDWIPSQPVVVFVPGLGQAYDRAGLAIDSNRRIWVQAWLRAAAAPGSYENQLGESLRVAVSIDQGLSFPLSTTLATTPWRAGGRLLSLGTRLIMIWNDYSGLGSGRTRFRIRDDGDPLLSWGPGELAFPDDANDGIYHGAALSAVADGRGGLHLAYKQRFSQNLSYRRFDGTAFGPRMLIDAGRDDWALQPAIALYQDDVYIFENHLVGSEAPPPPSLNRYQLRVFRLSHGLGSRFEVLAAEPSWMGYPTVPERLPSTVGAIPLVVAVAPDGGARANVVAVRLHTAPTAAVDFNLEASPSQLVSSGGRPAVATVTLRAGAGFQGAVQLSASGLPPGSVATFEPRMLSVPGSSARLTVAPAGAPGAWYPLAITGVSEVGSVTRRVNVGYQIDNRLPAPPCDVPLAGVRDDFTAGLAPGLWNVETTAGTATASGGVLTLTPQAGSAAAAVFVTRVEPRALTHSAVTARVASVVDAGGGVNAKLLAMADGDPGNALGFWYEGGVLYPFHLIDGVLTRLATLSYSPTAHAWWRLRHQDGTVRWETSADGSTFVTQASVPAGTFPFTLDALQLQFNVRGYGKGAATAAPVRFVQLNP